MDSDGPLSFDRLRLCHGDLLWGFGRRRDRRLFMLSCGISFSFLLSLIPTVDDDSCSHFAPPLLPLSTVLWLVLSPPPVCFPLGIPVLGLMARWFGPILCLAGVWPPPLSLLDVFWVLLNGLACFRGS